MAQATPEVEFIVPLVAAAAQGAELPLRRKSQPPLLHESFANCSLLCALPGCSARSCVASGKKLLLCSGCRCSARCVAEVSAHMTDVLAADWHDTVALSISGSIGRCCCCCCWHCWVHIIYSCPGAPARLRAMAACRRADPRVMALQASK